MAARIFLAVYFGGLKIRPPSWPAKWPSAKKLAGFLAAQHKILYILIFLEVLAEAKEKRYYIK
ncbi:hypothetical protein BpHYR1_016494 [Brachionus plicatilis]|uniref:Uncharacterized protein n=1 Tax=Brachionus plicatilis TaxID=10195 RepID=A0A3M7T4V0_BRAPC|nr:hypothetical protein BpHYR1_016494 [Brachionus plicatilis]